MEECGLLLLVHGEGPAPPRFERERSFLESTFKPSFYLDWSPHRPEHCTTAEAAAFVQSGPPNVCASVTPQHLLFNRNHMLAGGIKPHLYCMPILKAEEDRAFLVKAVTAPGQKKFFLGTDSAPHEVGNKHSACGCAGVFSAHASLEFYAEVFEDAGCLERLEAFSSQNGADFYGFAPNTEKDVLKPETSTPPPAYPFAG